MSKNNYCEQIKSKLSRYLDNELSEDELRFVKQHIRSCIGCALELEQLRKIDMIGKAEVFQDTGDDLWLRQRKHIAAETGGTIMSGDAKQKIVPLKRSLFRSSGVRVAISLSAAAALILFVTKAIYQTDEVFVPEESMVASQIPGEEESSQKSIEDTVPDAQQIADAAASGHNQVSETRVSDVAEQQHIIFHDADQYSDRTHIAAFNIQQETQETAGPETDVLSQVPLVQSSSADVQSDPQSINNKERSATVSAFQSSGITSEFFGISGSAHDAVTLPQDKFTSDDEFEIYLEQQKTLQLIRDPAIQKNGWLSFLQTVQEKDVQDLVVYELYRLYTSIVDRGSAHELKIEAIDFLIHYRESVEGFLGAAQYKERLDRFSKLF